MVRWRVRVGDEEVISLSIRKVVIFIISLIATERLTLGRAVSYILPVLKTLKLLEVLLLLKESLKDMGRNANILCDVLKTLPSEVEEISYGNIPDETILSPPDLKILVRLIYRGKIHLSKEPQVFIILRGFQNSSLPSREEVHQKEEFQCSHI